MQNQAPSPTVAHSPAPPRRTSPLWRKSAILGHLTGFGLMLGGTAAVMLLGLAGEADQGVNRVVALTAAAQLQNWVVGPGFALALLSGGALALIGPFGLVRYRWMIAKLVVTAVLFMHSQVEYRPLTQVMLEVARTVSQGHALPPTWADDFFHFTRVGVIQIAVAVLLAGLGVFKPGGQTRWGKKVR